MEVKLDREDIVKELKNSYINDTMFLCEIIDRCTNNWESYRDIVRELLQRLDEENETNDLEKYIKRLKNKKL